MALVIKDRVKESSTTTGTGTYTLAGAEAGFQTFAAIGNGNTTYYAATDGTDWEVGIGTYTSSGTTLARTTILSSSNSDSAVDWGSGTKLIFCTQPSSKAVMNDADDKFFNGDHFSNYVDFDGISHPTHSEGRFFYDSTHKTFNYMSDISGVVHEVGLEEHQRVYNNTGSTIAKGKPLYFSGNYTAGDIDVPTVGLANATDQNAYNAQGLAAHDISNNSYGYMIIAGQLTDFDTSGLSASNNFFVGLSAGAVQNASPTYPNYPMCLGWVVKSHATEGIVLVNQQNHSVNSFRVRTDAHIGADLIVSGDLTVQGTQTSTSSNNVELGASFQYLNAGDTIGDSGTTHTGSGLDDATLVGHYTGTASNRGFYVEIDGTGTPDTFKWSHNSDLSSPEATGVNITGNDQTLAEGISVNFGATTGHTSGDKWGGTASPANVDTGFFTNYNTGTSGTGYTHTGVFWDASASKWVWLSEYDPEPEGTIDLSDSSVVYATIKAGTIEANVTGDVTGDLTGDVTGNVSGYAVTLDAGDNDRAKFGTDDDLQIWHDGTYNHIYGAVGKDTYITGGNALYLRAKNGEQSVTCVKDAEVQLYHNNVKKMETTSTGSKTTGTHEATTVQLGDWTITEDGNGKLAFSHSGTVKATLDDTGTFAAANDIFTDETL